MGRPEPRPMRRGFLCFGCKNLYDYVRFLLHDGAALSILLPTRWAHAVDSHRAELEYKDASTIPL
jgi:hypothetical protein